VLELAGLDATPLDVRIDLALLQANDPAEAVGGQLTFVDEAIERAGRDAEPIGGLAGAEPDDAADPC
jgi:hypothetical protein